MSESGSASDAKLCANNCGFYGTPKNRNLCSVCYAASLKETGEDSGRRESSHDVVPGAELVGVHDEAPDFGTRESSPPAPASASASESTSSATSGSEAGSSNPAPKTKNRCTICKKKVGLLGFNCRCGGLFCGRHRHPEEHSCGVDRKAIGREILEKQIVECKADKLEFRV
ncbi:zinc finger A20 and AN1 domain-containing stress-associated protein 5-like [Momordica charantia]|uniref:Zinc finger A20 and AN1 domain-containing stress-associated protein 5-like n=1 Tax=Momordica charantia TaxID=3673 RepID=A0A6J1CI30_MOMCH|nr:zinc finger A20 and AN1 domain-containing stress-associated protein 5-like [Momordica charantia]